jgi:hypothetical protein
MPSATSTTDPAELRQRASGLLERAAEAQARVDELERADAIRRAEQETEAAREVVANFSRAALDKTVEDAEAALHAAIRDMAAVRALAAVQAAQTRRYRAVADLLAARGRLGLSTEGQLPPSAAVGPLSDFMAPIVQQLATEENS